MRVYGHCIDPCVISDFLLVISFKPVQPMSQLGLIFDATNKIPDQWAPEGRWTRTLGSSVLSINL